MTRRGASLAILVLGACGGSDDSTPPTIVSITPASGAAEVWLHDPITVTFSEPIAPESIDDTSVALSAGATTTSLSADGTTLTIRAEADVAAIGAVELDVSTAVTDVAGNALLEAGAVTYDLAAWSRPTAGLDRGDRGNSPTVALLPDGAPIIAWTIGAIGARRVVVSRLDATSATALGAELGTQDTALPSIVVGTDGQPIVVWTELETASDPSTPASIQAARWDGAAWQPLPSPGAGTLVVAAVAPDGTPAIAWRSGSGAQADRPGIAVRTLAGDTWQSLPGGDIALTGDLVGVPALDVPAAGAPVVGFIETTGAGAPDQLLRVYRHANAWTPEPPFPLGPRTNAGQLNVSLAATATSLYVAFDRHNGQSFGAHVITRADAGWTRVGGELDVDSPANAQAPAIELDTTGAPVVTWRERVEGAWRGFVMRWDGNTWRAVGGDAWNTDATTGIVGMRLALAGGHAPVVVWSDIVSTDANGVGRTTVHVARWNGPATPRLGRDARASIAGCSLGDANGNPPATLSATGCFTIAAGKATPHAGLVPFDLRSELWSDGALKRRWLALPDGTAMTTPDAGAWTAPPGTMIIKEFAIETSPGDGRTRRVMETRFLTNGASSGGGITAWSGFSYRWRADGSDADLLPDASSTVDWPLANGNTHTHVYPSRADCQRCHHASHGPLLGLRSGQLARRADYGGVMSEQLDTLAHLGVITPDTTTRAAPFASPHDALATPIDRVRGYLAANCAHCHNPGGERATRDFRWETPLAQTNLCGVVTPGSPSTSLIYQRISTRPGMPPLATLATDPLAVALVSQWISGISACP